MTYGIRERTLYDPLGTRLREIGYTCIINPRDKEGEPDFLSVYKNVSFVIEVKIGIPEKQILDALMQSRGYLKKANTDNLIVLVYPETVKRPVTTQQELYEIEEAQTITAYFYTDYLTAKIRGTSTELFQKFKERIEQQEKETDINFAIDVLQESINSISHILRSYSDIKISDVIDIVTGRFDLFLALGETKKDKSTMKSAAIDLTSYLFVNQLLFYHIFSVLNKSDKDKVDILPDEITSKEQICNHFKQITKIDYQAISVT